MATGDDPPADPMPANPKPPFGLRLTILFVRAMTMVIVFPVVGAGTATIWSLVAGSFDESPFPEAIVLGAMALAAFAVTFSLLIGASWLERDLTDRTTVPDPHQLANQPVHPGRLILLPALGFIALYGIMAVLLWFPSTWVNDVARTASWPLFWTPIGIGALFLYRHLAKTLPR